MKTLVTGGAGFIGSNLAEALLDAKHEVIVVDNLATGKKENIPKGAKFYEVDITQKAKLKEVFEKEKPEAVFHLAAQASVQNSIDNPANDVNVNIVGTIRLLELCQEYEVKNFIFSSTGGAIYGEEATRPTPETAKEEPLTPYGMDKLSAEKYVSFFGKNSSFAPICLRYANVYGPKQDPKGEAGVVAIFTDKLLSNSPIDIFGDGEQTRDFVYVSDVVRANLQALESKLSDTFNIGSGVETTINEVASIMKIAASSKSEINYAPAKLEQKHSLLDNHKAELDLDWKPQVTLEQGLRNTIEYFKK